MHHFNQLGRVRVEIDHIARLFRRLSARVHRHRDVRLCQCRGVVGAVAGHCHQTSFGLVLTNQRQFGFRRGFRQKIIHACFGGNRGGG
ncbi:hypothetical protein D3C80_1597320 [compost metagenome]